MEDKKQNYSMSTKTKEEPTVQESKEAKELKVAIKRVFENFPNVDIVYHDGKEVFFNFAKPKLTEIRRSDFFNKK
jgi:formaldehyde-activating enzyme involved in methanogenesis